MSALATAGLQPLDTSERGSVYLLPLQGGGYVRLAPGAVRLLRAVEAGATFEELARTARRREGGPVAAAEIESAYTGILERIAEAERQAQAPTGAFWLRLRLIPARWVERIAAVGALAYHPAAAALLALLVGVGGWLVLSGPARPASALSSAFWPGYAVFLASLLAHEIGHASACARYRARPSEIGFVLYLIYPAFYSNVSEAWTLRRWQRVVVDLGGVYFELVFGALCALAYAWTGWGPLGVTLTMIGASCLLSLNPVLKFDGYWVVADALGVTNLGRQPKLLLRRLMRTLRGEPSAPLPWPAPVAAVLAAYTVVSLVFLAWFLGMLAPVVAGVALRYPDLLAEAARSTWQLSWPPRLGELATATYVLAFAGLMAARLAGPPLGRAASRLGRPGIPLKR
jgi:putative peptide zinc metalloprotease protein